MNNAGLCKHMKEKHICRVSSETHSCKRRKDRKEERLDRTGSSVLSWQYRCVYITIKQQQSPQFYSQGLLDVFWILRMFQLFLERSCWLKLIRLVKASSSILIPTLGSYPRLRVVPMKDLWQEMYSDDDSLWLVTFTLAALECLEKLVQIQYTLTRLKQWMFPMFPDHSSALNTTRPMKLRGQK